MKPLIEQIIQQTVEHLQSLLVGQTEVKNDAIVRPTAYFNSIQRFLSCIIGIVALKQVKLQDNETSSVNGAFLQLEKLLGGDCLFIRYFKQLTEFELKELESFFQWFQTQKPVDIKLSDLYELMLLIEFKVENGTITRLHQESQSNSIGSFYTPAEVADIIVRITIDNYIKRNLGIDEFSSSIKVKEQARQVTHLLLNSSFADHSCGTGSFLLAILRYTQVHLSDLTTNELKALVLKFNAIEADPLALEIAKLLVLDAVTDLGMFDQLSTNFINRNPLIEPDGNTQISDFHPEFYYHNGLAIDRKHLPVCDIVVGNPPWGPVNFELGYCIHLTVPRILELNDDSEQENSLDDLAASHPELHEWLMRHEVAIDLAAENIYNDNRFEHSAMGGLQTNLLFTELVDSLCTAEGSVGLLLKSSTLSDPTNKRLWNHLVNRKRVIARYDFINSNHIFNLDKTEEFSVLILGDTNRSNILHRTALTSLDQLLL